MAGRRDRHPIMPAAEGPTGVWRMVDAPGRDYGLLEICRVMNGADTRCKTTWRGEVIGWAITLREACERVHQAYLRAHGPGGAPMAGWGDAWLSVWVLRPTEHPPTALTDCSTTVSGPPN